MPRKKTATATVTPHVNGAVNGIINGQSGTILTEALEKVTRADLVPVGIFSREQALAVVGLYHDIQKLRLATQSKVRSHDQCVDILSESSLIRKLRDNLERVEKDCSKGLLEYARSQKLGRWCMSCLGVGHVSTATLLAEIDLERAQTAGAIWKFCGQLPREEQRWRKGVKRCYNPSLKAACWNLGQSIKRASVGPITPEELAKMTPEQRERLDKRRKSQESPAGLYCRLYRERKALEQERNERGEFSHRAAMRLEEAVEGRYKIYEDQKKAWEEGKLQPMGLDLRAIRYTVKIFLSHYHTVGREMLGLPIPRPWALEHGGHAHYIAPPNWPMDESVKELATVSPDSIESDE